MIQVSAMSEERPVVCMSEFDSLAIQVRATSEKRTVGGVYERVRFFVVTV